MTPRSRPKSQPAQLSYSFGTNQTLLAPAISIPSSPQPILTPVQLINPSQINQVQSMAGAKIFQIGPGGQLVQANGNFSNIQQFVLQPISSPVATTSASNQPRIIRLQSTPNHPQLMPFNGNFISNQTPIKVSFNQIN